MKNLPNNFLTKIAKRTGINSPNLSRYFHGHVVPRPDRAKLLSSELKKEDVNIPPEDFIFKSQEIKANIMGQLEKISV